jgi:hypothetical protein
LALSTLKMLEEQLGFGELLQFFVGYGLNEAEET